MVVALDYRAFFSGLLWDIRFGKNPLSSFILSHGKIRPILDISVIPRYVREKKYFVSFFYILLWPIKLAFQPKITGFFRNVGAGRGSLLQNIAILLGFGQHSAHVSEVEKNTLIEITPNYSSKNRSVDLGGSGSEFDIDDGDEESDTEPDEKTDSDALYEEIADSLFLDEIEGGLLATDPENPLEYVQERMKEKWGDIYTDEEIEELAYVFAKEHTIKHGISDKSMGRMVQKAFSDK